jgi:hypothetical protein
VPGRPGLYAIYGGATTWNELGLGEPPDGRPLYIGKAEDSLVTRDLKTHFGDGRTGQSTVRRSFAQHELGKRGPKSIWTVNSICSTTSSDTRCRKWPTGRRAGAATSRRLPKRSPTRANAPREVGTPTPIAPS